MHTPRGHIKLARKLFAEHPWWTEPRTFSRFEAWVDVLQLAQWRERTHQTKYGPIALKRGEFVASLRWLGSRWKWSAMKVTRWLAEAEKSGQLARQTESHAGIVYLIVNYDRYQTGETDAETAGETVGDTDARQTRDKNKQEKQVKQNPSTPSGGADAPTPTPSRGSRKPRAPKPAPSEVPPEVPPEGPPAGHWVDDAVQVWGAVGVVTHGKMGGQVKPLVDARGWPAVRAGMLAYIAGTVGRPRNLGWFVADAGQWIDRATSAAPCTADGWFTPEFDRESAPDPRRVRPFTSAAA